MKTHNIAPRLRPLDWHPVAEAIDRSNRLVVATHSGPDGDALGSTIALTRYLISLGKDARAIVPSPIEERFDFLVRDIEVEVFEPSLHEDLILGADTIIILDTSQWTLLGDIADVISRSDAPRIVIDHHRGPSDLAQSGVVEPEASSTAELVYDLLTWREAPIDAISAAALFTALATDTGWFRFQRVRPALFRAAADLLSRGVSAYDIYTRLFESRSWPALNHLGVSIQRFEPRLSGRAAFLLLDSALHRQIKADGLSTESLLDFGLSVRDVEVCALLRDVDGIESKISLRSKGRVDVSAIARQLGGGGHHNAAGILLHLPYEQAALRLEATLRPVIEGLTQ